MAEASDGEIAGFFIIKYPDKDDNLGTYLGFDDRQLSQVAVMDSAAVDTAFRGNGLQGRMLEAAENLLDPDRFVYLMCTVHPENRFSRYNMESHGYQVKKIARCYGGLERCIHFEGAQKINKGSQWKWKFHWLPFYNFGREQTNG